eukprot:5208948-Pyramimonas_sp.AAC.1
MASPPVYTVTNRNTCMASRPVYTATHTDTCMAYAQSHTQRHLHGITQRNNVRQHQCTDWPPGQYPPMPTYALRNTPQGAQRISGKSNILFWSDPARTLNGPP